MSNWKMYFISTFAILFASSILYALKKTARERHFSGLHSEEFALPYNVADPDTVYIMPKKLKEISGLSFLDTNQVLTINDEKANLYTYNYAEGKVVSIIDFGKKGDYEGLTRKGDIVYITKSNGTIKAVDLRQGKKIAEYNTALSKRNNVEGLCYDKSGDQLLLACKGSLIKKLKKRNAKGIYTFNLITNKLEAEPYKLIEIGKEKSGLLPLNLLNDQLSKFTIQSRLKAFSPSAIAINPITSNIYVLSSRGNILIVMNPNKKIIGIYFLSRHIYGQPEGITFNDNGDMYISNEARSTQANIVKITRQIEEEAEVEGIDCN